MADKSPSFSDRLSNWRLSRGWSQKVAASNIGVDVDVYRKWEQGRNEPHESPSMAEILKRMEDAK